MNNSKNNNMGQLKWSTYPLQAAKCSGVIPILSCTLTCAPLLSRKVTESIAPVLCRYCDN